MTTAILHQFENLLPEPFSKLIIKSDFSTKVSRFLQDLCSKEFLNKVINAKKTGFNSNDFIKKIIEFTKNILPELELEEEQLEFLNNEYTNLVNKLDQPEEDLKDIVQTWQQFFKQLMIDRNKKDLAIKLLWKAYLENQKQEALNPCTSVVKESFDGYGYQVNADPLKRLGALLFELLSEIINGFIYVTSEGQNKLFDRIDKKNSDRSPGEEQVRQFWAQKSGNPDAAPVEPSARPVF